MTKPKQVTPARGRGSQKIFEARNTHTHSTL